jgi:hypothetical protein
MNWIVDRSKNQLYFLATEEKTMRSFCVSLVAAALIWATPLSLRGSHGVMFGSADAAEMGVTVRPHRGATTHRHYAGWHSRVHDIYYSPAEGLWCGGPYVGDGFNGGAYYGGPWMDLRCYDGVY